MPPEGSDRHFIVTDVALLRVRLTASCDFARGSESRLPESIDRVTMFQRMWDLAKGIAHDSATDAIQRERHALFIASKLSLAIAALTAAPLYLAYVGAPSPIEALALAFALTPCAAAFVVSRTGRLGAGGALSIAGLIGFALAVSYSTSGAAAAAAGLLFAVPIEAFLAGALPLVGAATFAAVIAAAACLFIGAGHAVLVLPSALLLALGLAYVGALSAGFVHLQSLRRRSDETARARFDGLAAVLPDLVLHMDRTGAVHGVAHHRARVLGLGVRDVAGRGLFERVHVADRPLFLKTVSDASISGGAVEVDIRLRGGVAHDEPAWFGHVRLRVGRVDEADDMRLIAVLRDVTDEKAHAEELLAARAAAEQSGASKDRFLANISHELRTPLNAIIGFSEILNSDMMPIDTARRREYAGIINSSGQHLLSVVNSILDISKIEAGSFQITPDQFELEPLIAQCCDMVRLKAEETGVLLRREDLGGLPEIVADKRAVKQILINLVSNAVKFTGSGGQVTLRARASVTAVVIEIEDSGIGVQARDLARLGDPFFQAKDSYDRPYEGTGLGLSVVRGLVGLHGGSIKIESAPGEGTRVTITLPLDCTSVPEHQRSRGARMQTVAAGPFPGLPTAENVRKIA